MQAMTHSHRHIRTHSGATLFICAALTTLALTGCASTATVAPPTATPAVEATPMFASDEEALATAETAFVDYLEIGDQIARDGGANPERLKKLVSQELYGQEIASLDFYGNGRLHAAGSTSHDSWTLQSLKIGNVVTSMTAYVCLRFSKLRILDGVGTDVTPVSRDADLPMLVELESPLGAERFVVDSMNVWTGSNFC